MTQILDMTSTSPLPSLIASDELVQCLGGYKYIRRVDSEEGFRFYDIFEIDPKTKEEKLLHTFPSVTSKIDAVYPKDAFLLDYIRKNGEEGKRKFEQAGEDGTEVHVAINNLLQGKEVPSQGMSKKVKKCIQAYIDWHHEFQPKIIDGERMVYNENYEFAGTYDLLCELDTEDYKGVYLIDFKTSAALYDSHKVQVACYHDCLQSKYPRLKTALLHLGNKTKKAWSFCEFYPFEHWMMFTSLNRVFRQKFGDIAPDRTVWPDYFTI